MSETHEPTVIVDTLNGAVRGKITQTCFGDEVTVFHKIPYMQPPIGKLRFKDPQPIENWEGVLDGTVEGSVFCQFDSKTNKIVGEEDALYVNAYTKNLNSEKLSPIIVFIHGGAFLCGSANRDEHSPDYLLREDIVYFSLSYRLGCYGFLTLDDPDLQIPGNAGLKDQTMALKWIKNNANVFGGDANNITVFGQSAGAASVSYHLISDLSKGLFHKAITSSGAAICEWALQAAKRKDYSLLLLKTFGWNVSESMTEVVDRIQNASIKEINNAEKIFQKTEDGKLDHHISWVPSIEPYISEQCFLSKPPLELIKNPWSTNVPLIVGGSTEEGLMFLCFNPFLQTNDAYEHESLFSNLYDIHSDVEENSPESKKIGAALIRIYYGKQKPILENRENFIRLINDKVFWHGMHETIKYRVNNPDIQAPTYMYRFHFENDFCNPKTTLGITDKGVTHGGEMPFLFKNRYYEKSGGLAKGTPEYKMMETMVGMWTHFANDGNPNCPEIGSEIWQPITSKNPPFKVLDISDELKYIELPETKRLESIHEVLTEF